MPLWNFTTKNKRQCNGVFVEKGMTVEVVTPTTSTVIPENEYVFSIRLIHGKFFLHG